jgi:patatin-like phospholipase/acyl hydrolase
LAETCYRVLALDGGGIRGLIAAEVLRKIEEQMRRPISEMFDLIAGTSTGGILALGLTKPDQNRKPQFTGADMCDLYLNEGRAIFPHSIFQEVKHSTGWPTPATRRLPSSGFWPSTSARRCSPRC